MTTPADMPVTAPTDAHPADHKPDLLSHDVPDVSLEQAADLALGIYGITGQIRPLGAEKDANFHIRRPSGEEVLLKVTNAAEDPGVTDMQTAALLHLQAVDPALPVQRVYRTLSGHTSHLMTGSCDQTHLVRVLSYLDGTVLGTTTAGPGLHRNIGAELARLTLGLRGFFHPAAGHVLQWDIKQAHGLRPLLAAVADPDLRHRLTDLLDRFDADIAPRLPHLRAQIVHNDFNPHNLLVDRAQATTVTGIIDFGDMVHTPVACDLAVACSYHIAQNPDPMDHICDLVAGFHAVLPLEDAELDLLPDPIRVRHAATLSIGAWRAQRYPQNAAYILRNGAASLRGLNALDRIGNATAVTLLREHLSRSDPR